MSVFCHTFCEPDLDTVSPNTLVARQHLSGGPECQRVDVPVPGSSQGGRLSLPLGVLFSHVLFVAGFGEPRCGCCRAG